MAMVKTSSLVSDISGRIGSVLFGRSNNGRMTVRENAPHRPNVNTSKQAETRQQVTDLSKQWSDTLTQAQRNAWEAYASVMPRNIREHASIIRKSHGIMSGFGAFIRNNMNLYSSEILALPALLSDAPIGTTPPDMPRDFLAFYSIIDTSLQINWTPGTIPGTRLRAWIRSKPIGANPQIARTLAIGATVANLFIIRATLGTEHLIGAFPINVDVQVDSVDDYGQVSPPSQLVRRVFVPKL